MARKESLEAGEAVNTGQMLQTSNKIRAEEMLTQFGRMEVIGDL